VKVEIYRFSNLTCYHDCRVISTVDSHHYRIPLSHFSVISLLLYAHDHPSPWQVYNTSILADSTVSPPYRRFNLRDNYNNINMARRYKYTVYATRSSTRSKAKSNVPKTSKPSKVRKATSKASAPPSKKTAKSVVARLDSGFVNLSKTPENMLAM
jgi:hypothetical protein